MLAIGVGAPRPASTRKSDGSSAKPSARKPVPDTEAKRAAKDITIRRPVKNHTWLQQAVDGHRKLAIAHRGNTEHGAAPNSIDSLEAAAKAKRADAVEMDIQELGDGTLVVYHDGDDAKIADGDLERMTKADLDEHPQIPTLEEWSKRAGELDVNVLAEFKGHGYEQEALDTLQRHVDADRLVTMSFDADALRGVRAVDPSVPTVFVPSRAEDADPVAEQVDDLGFVPDAVEVADAGISEETLSSMDERGIPVLAGKDDVFEQHRLLNDDRVVGVLTNRSTQASLLRDGVGPFVASWMPDWLPAID
jgi:glycerophosphoryl diester phosphodiesterase